MATSLVLYSFSKRINSTARPSGGTTFEVALKDGASIYNPIFILYSTSFLPTAYNYAQWEGYYYYINDCVTLSNYTYELQCGIDVLATARSEILSSTQYFLRTSTRNGYLPDSMVKPTAEIVNSKYLTSSIDEGYLFSREGCYLLHATGTSGSVTGVNVYAVESSNLPAIFQAAFNQDNFTDTLITILTQEVFNPSQYIISLEWTPYSYNEFVGNETTVKLGFLDTGVTAINLTQAVYYTSFTIPNISEMESVYGWDDYRSYDDRYTQSYLQLPLYGVIGIPSSILKSSQIDIDYYLDVVGGDGDITVIADTVRVASYSFKSTVPTQASASSINLSALTEAVTTTATGGVMAYMGMPGGVAGIAEGVSGAYDIFKPLTSIIGQGGGRAQIYGNPLYPYLGIIQVGSTGTAIQNCGYPTNKTGTVSSYSFVMCNNASVNCGLPENLKQEINGYLNSGMWVE